MPGEQRHFFIENHCAGNKGTLTGICLFLSLANEHLPSPGVCIAASKCRDALSTHGSSYMNRMKKPLQTKSV